MTDDFALTPQQLELRERATEAGRELRDEAARWDADDSAPYQRIAARMGELGFFGLTMPTEFGGHDGTAMDYLIATSAIFRASQSWIPGEPLFCTSGPGPSMLLLADEPLRQKYLPDIVQGAKGCAIALTEPNHGSDLTYLETTASEKGGEVVINGEKSFITGAVENELYAVFARFDDIPGAKGIGAVIVERDTPGFTMDRGPVFVGDRGIPHGNLHLENVVVPAENIVRGAGSFAEIMTAFNMERLHNASFSLGLMEAAYDEAAAYVQKREVFGRPIIEFQSTYHTLADMWVTIEAHRLLSYRAAKTAIDGHFPKPLDVSVAKLFGGTQLPLVTIKALELHGGVGVTMDYAIQRIHRDGISALVAGGSPPVLRNSIAAQLFPGRKFPQTRP